MRPTRRAAAVRSQGDSNTPSTSSNEMPKRQRKMTEKGEAYAQQFVKKPKDQTKPQKPVKNAAGPSRKPSAAKPRAPRAPKPTPRAPKPTPRANSPPPSAPTAIQQKFMSWDSRQVMCWAGRFVLEQSDIHYLYSHMFNGAQMRDICTSSSKYRSYKMPSKLHSLLKYRFSVLR